MKIVVGFFVVVWIVFSLTYIPGFAFFQGSLKGDCEPLGKWGYVFPHYEPTCKGFRWMAGK